MDPAAFGERYYREDFGRPYRPDDYWLGFYAAIADEIVAKIKPRRLLDAGCAMGMLVDALRARGVDAYGFDISSYARLHTPPAARPYCWQASVTDEIAGDYDVIVCLEVLTHLPLDQAERAVANFCRHSADVLFSLSHYGPAPLHANLAPPPHWAGVFAQHDFQRDFTFDGSRITPWAVRYRKSLHKADQLVQRYEDWALTMRSERNDERARRIFAEQTVLNMERSWFWKARALWQRIRSLAALRPTTRRD